MSSEPGIIWIEKDKDARLNYKFLLDAELVQGGDSYAELTWVVTPINGIYIEASAVDVNIESASFNGAEARMVISGGTPGAWYSIVFTWKSVAGLSDQFVVRLTIAVDAESLQSQGSGLFPSRLAATAGLRRDRLVSASGVLTNQEFSDDYLWEKLRAAESEVARTLRVRLVPTRFFPVEPTAAEIAALPAGMPWDIDPGYDLGPESNSGDRWGMITTRHKPIISIERYRFAYPASDGLAYDVPLAWLRPDKKYGMISVVPTSFSISLPLSSLVMQALSAGRNIPLMLQVSYTAGLANAARDFPELVDVVKKLAALKLLEDRFLPQSGSVSADGLSQSVSIDMDKYRDTIDHTLNGGKGSHGGLMSAIHGVRMAVF